jgi:SAM-dependent methyltransferase
MNLTDLINRLAVPVPWEEGDNIPWDEPGFSQRMLSEHLNPNHDHASRRPQKIDRHVQWIHHEVLGGQPARILDLGCGPGLYTSRLARLGHQCVGIDFSPASIAHAREQAQRDRLDCTYIHDDLRAAEYGDNFGLVMMLFGEFNVFSVLDARSIVRKVSRALAAAGVLLLEPHTFTALQRWGQSGASWYSSRSGLWADKPHLCLRENFWDEERRAATIRYFIIDATSRQVTPYAQSLQAYTTEEYDDMLAQRGLEEIQYYPALGGERDSSQSDFFALTAREGADAT